MSIFRNAPVSIFRSTLLWVVGSLLLAQLLPLAGMAGTDSESSAAPSTVASQTNSRLPEELKGVGITEKLGARIELSSLRFRDEAGAVVPLSTYFQRGGKARPVLLNLVYFNCPNLCTLVLSGLLDGLKGFDWNVGEQFDVISVSIDPREGAKLAEAKKRNYLKAYGRAGAEDGWRFLTGEESQIRALADQAGFGYRYDEREKQYAHGAALFVLTPDGRISRVLYGVEFKPKDLKLALLEASDGKIGTIVERFLLFCYRYDPVTRTYSVTITRVLQVASLATVLLLGGYLALFWRLQRRRRGSPDSAAANSGLSPLKAELENTRMGSHT